MTATRPAKAIPNAVMPNAVTTAELTQHVSASRLTTFHRCRLQFYFRYALGISKSKSASLHVGTTVHAVLQEWNRARWHGKKITTEALRVVFDQSWKDEQEFVKVDWEGENENKEKEGAWHLFQCYLAQTPIKPNEKLEAVEVTVDADLRKHGLTKLSGIIDLVRFKGKDNSQGTFGASRGCQSWLCKDRKAVALSRCRPRHFKRKRSYLDRTRLKAES